MTPTASAPFPVSTSTAAGYGPVLTSAGYGKVLTTGGRVTGGKVVVSMTAAG